MKSFLIAEKEKYPTLTIKDFDVHDGTVYIVDEVIEVIYCVGRDRDGFFIEDMSDPNYRDYTEVGLSECDLRKVLLKLESSGCKIYHESDPIAFYRDVARILKRFE